MINLSNVCKSFGKTQVIKNVSLHLAPGTTIGLVGRSGSGKTTLTKLIQGLYPLQGGIIV